MVRTLSRAVKCQIASSCCARCVMMRFDPSTRSRESIVSLSIRYSTSAR
jgi:hypothetical protein